MKIGEDYERLIEELILKVEKNNHNAATAFTYASWFAVATKEAIEETNKEEIRNIKRFIERLKGYSCGYHKQLEKQMLNRIKELKS